jgi:hypothetical protein
MEFQNEKRRGEVARLPGLRIETWATQICGLLTRATRLFGWSDGFRPAAHLLVLPATHHPADRCSSRDAYRECRRYGFDRMPLHAPSGVNIKL